MEVKEKVRRILNAALDKKALGPVVLETRDLTDLADYIVIVSGTSDRHVRAIADSVEMAMRAMKERPIGIEGEKEGRWVLIDGADVIVHVFYEPVREFYGLEKLWMDAPRFTADPEGGDLRTVSGANQASLHR